MFDQMSKFSEIRATHQIFSLNRNRKGASDVNNDKKKETRKREFNKKKENKKSVTSKLISYKQITLPGIPFAR